MRRVAVLGALLGALLLSAGCAPAGDGVDGRTAGQTVTSAPTTSAPTTSTSAVATLAAPSLPPVDGVEGQVVRLRTDEALGGQVQARLTDSSDSTLTVTAVALRSPAFADQPLVEQTAAYRPGQTIDLPVPFGAVDCTAAVQPVAAEVVLSRSGGAAETVLVPLAGDAMETVYAEECAVQRVMGFVTVTVQGLTAAGDAAVGDVVLTRVAGSPDVDIDVLSLERSVLLTPETNDPLPAALAAGEDELVLPVSVTLASCDPHVLAETKKPFVFPLLVQVDGENAPVDLPLDDVQRGELQALVDRVCG